MAAPLLAQPFFVSSTATTGSDCFRKLLEMHARYTYSSHFCLISPRLCLGLLLGPAKPDHPSTWDEPMRVYIQVKSFIEDDTAAVTVDWVVLAAALVSLGLAVTNAVGSQLEQLSEDIQTQLLTDHRYDGFELP